MSEKSDLRAAALAARAALDPAQRSAADRALVVAAVRLARTVTRVAAYVPLPDEPAFVPVAAPAVPVAGRVDPPAARDADAASAPLHEALAAALPPGGLLLPILLPDLDLDWAALHAGSAATSTIPSGTVLAPGTVLRLLSEPTGVRLGAEAIATAELVLVPALLVDQFGTRLGRGGGSYDRALRRVRPGVPIVALLYPGELVEQLPAEQHDRPVTAVLTPAGVTSVTAQDRG
jgi:5-formyltetrahydrofolate cyclo-ligase